MYRYCATDAGTGETIQLVLWKSNAYFKSQIVAFRLTPRRRRRVSYKSQTEKNYDDEADGRGHNGY